MPSLVRRFVEVSFQVFEELLPVEGYADFEGFKRKAIVLANHADELLWSVYSRFQVDRHLWLRKKRVSFEDATGKVLSDHKDICIRGSSVVSLSQ